MNKIQQTFEFEGQTIKRERYEDFYNKCVQLMNEADNIGIWEKSGLEMTMNYVEELLDENSDLKPGEEN